MPRLHDPSVRASLEQRLNSLAPDAPRRWGTMSVEQMLWHVNQGLRMALGDAAFRPIPVPLPRPVMKFLVLNLPWPKGAPTHPQAVATGQYDFHKERAECLALIDKMCCRRLDEPWPDSPTFGKVSGSFASRLQAKHLDHHFKQFSA